MLLQNYTASYDIMNTGSTEEFDDTTMFENKNALAEVSHLISDIVFEMFNYLCLLF